MHIIIISILLFLNSEITEFQCVPWQKAKSFDFYELPAGFTVEKMGWADIEKAKHIRINEAGAILSNSECKATRMALWKGEYLLVVEFVDGKRKRFKVSDYGGFLYEPGARFYYIQEKDRDKWESILQDVKRKANN